MIMKHLFFTALAAAGATILLSGCFSGSSNTPRPVFKDLEKADVLIKNDKQECLELFNPKRDHTSSHLVHMTLKPGKALKSRTSQSPEVLFVTEGSGMINIDSVAYILKKNLGIYIPEGSTIQLTNNSKKNITFMIVTKKLESLSASKPVVFDKNAPKSGESQSYKEVISSEPLNINSSKEKSETLSPSESKVKTLSEEGYK